MLNDPPPRERINGLGMFLCIRSALRASPEFHRHLEAMVTVKTFPPHQSLRRDHPCVLRGSAISRSTNPSSPCFKADRSSFESSVEITLFTENAAEFTRLLCSGVPEQLLSGKVRLAHRVVWPWRE